MDKKKLEKYAKFIEGLQVSTVPDEDKEDLEWDDGYTTGYNAALSLAGNILRAIARKKND